MFIHDSLSELVMCGETEVVAGDLRIKMMSLQNPVTGDTSDLTGFEKQFQVLTYWYKLFIEVKSTFRQSHTGQLATNLMIPCEYGK